MTTEQLQVGRVIFTEDVWRVQTLRNHVGNVTQLAQLWDNEVAQFYDTPNLDITRDALVRAAEIHDMGKPKRFKLTFNATKHEWSYSFAGHRFLAEETNKTPWKAYIESLAHLHHEYSVEGITKHVAQLKLDQNLRQTGVDRLHERLPLDLYILEMCDQIEATVSSAYFGDKAPEGRVFMDFQFGAIDKVTYWVDPFIFSDDSLSLHLEWAEIVPDQTLIDAVEATTTDKNDAYPERKALKKWLIDELQKVTLSKAEVLLCPLIQ